jgi:hypothetical protein
MGVKNCSKIFLNKFSAELSPEPFSWQYFEPDRASSKLRSKGGRHASRPAFSALLNLS